MIVEHYGTFIHIRIEANELSEGHVSVKLADGYSYERIFINDVTNIAELYACQSIRIGDKLTFPPINCKSPSIIYLYVPDITKTADIRFTIEKFGQIPDEHYFDNAFEPILVTGDDGKEYKVIPSDQFK